MIQETRGSGGNVYENNEKDLSEENEPTQLEAEKYRFER